MTNVLTKFKRKVKKISSSKVYNIILVTNNLGLSLFTYIFGLKKLSKVQLASALEKLLTRTAVLITESKQQGIDKDLTFS